MSKPSGRFSRYPAVNRDIPGHGATYPEREAAATNPTPPSAPSPARVNPEPEVEVEVESVVPRFTVDLSEMTVTEVLEWVGDDESRRHWARSEEIAGRNRKGIVAAHGA